ncbi:MAG: hypothetical protein KDB61_14825 [Planctomycetes bacterium]|nr:hypothetical protein [Planctomycetota bacterium]
MRIVQWVLIAISSLVLHSCIEGDEEVWIHADGSARVKATYRVPGLVMTAAEADELTALVAEEVGADAGLRLLANRVDLERGQRVIRIEVEAADITRLEDLVTEHAPGGERSKADKMLHALLGSIDVKAEGLSASLRREVDITPLLDEYVGKNAAVLLSEAEFRYAVHLPKSVERTNAHAVSDGGRTLRWKYRLGDLRREPMVMEMAAPVPLPWWVYAALGGIVVLVVVLLALRVVRARRPAVSAT